jgi:hypothetical protein
VPEGAIGAYGMEFSVLGSWAAGGLVGSTLAGSETAGGFGFLVGQIFAYVTAVLAGVDPPGASTLLRDAGTLLLDDFSNSGLAVFTGLQSATQLAQAIETVVTQTKGSLPASPQGGLVLPASQPANPPANTRPATVYTGSGVGPKWIATPINQQVTTLTSVTLPPPAVARFNGSYAGSSSVSCTVQTPDGPFTTGGSGAATATVLNGVITSDGNVGTVSDTGRFTAPYVAAGGVGCTVGGRFWLDPSGAAGASGFLACSGSGVSCSGSWGLTRAR